MDSNHESGATDGGFAWLRFQEFAGGLGPRVAVQRREGWLRIMIKAPPADVVFSPAEIPVLLAWLTEQFPASGNG